MKLDSIVWPSSVEQFKFSLALYVEYSAVTPSACEGFQERRKLGNDLPSDQAVELKCTVPNASNQNL